MNDKLNRALHTLWQAAGGATTAELLVHEFASHDSAELKATLIATGTAVVGAGLSLARTGVKHWLESHKNSKAAKAAAELLALADQVGEVNAARAADEHGKHDA